MKLKITILLILITFGNLFSTVWTVDDDSTAQFVKIQDAVDSAQDGDTVFVFPGIYSENINLFIKTIWLIGSGKDNTFVISNNGYLLYAHKECYIYNLNLDGNTTSEVGIKLASNSIINNNIIKNFSYCAIKIPFGPSYPNSDILIKNNKIINNHYGIFFEVDYPGHPDSIKIIGNTITNNDYGITYFPEQIVCGPPFDTTWHVNADSNYWGYFDQDSIDRYIWDKNDTSKAIAQIHYNYWYNDSIDTFPNYFSTGIHYNNIYNNTLYNIYAFNDQGTGINDNLTLTPNNFILRQNYPNPFNNQTVISFEIRKKSKVNMFIYNLVGQKIETLVNNQEYGPGNHRIIWRSNRSSGIYFIYLSNGTENQIIKTLLIK